MKYLPLVLALMVAGTAVGQGGSAQADYDKLTKAFDAAMTAYSNKLKEIRATDEYQDLLKKARNREDRAASRAARTKMRDMTADVERPRPADWAGKFKTGADKHAGTDGAVPFLTWLITRGGPDYAGDAFATIAAKHAASKKVGDVVDTFRYIGRSVGRDKVRALATAIIEKNPDADIKANAYYGRAMNYGERDGRRIVLSDEEKAKKAADIAACIKTAPNSIGALRANAPTFQKERLQIGMEVPDIEGKDLDGVAFKLSDYRGKVVVLDFWGDW